MLTGFSPADHESDRESAPSHDTPRLRGGSLRDTLRNSCLISAP